MESSELKEELLSKETENAQLQEQTKKMEEKCLHLENARVRDDVSMYLCMYVRVHICACT